MIFLNIWPLHEICVSKCMGTLFCVQFPRVHTSSEIPHNKYHPYMEIYNYTIECSHQTLVSFHKYTSAQCYGITATKWHLREFDWYLLFLVACSIAEQNTVDFIHPLHNQIEWPNTVNIGWGPLRLKRRKKVSSGVVTWSEVCLAINILMF